MLHRSSYFYSLRRWSGLLALLAALMLFAPAALAQDVAPAAGAPGLEAGRSETYEQQVPINLVFVGYEQADFKLNDLRDWLPAGYEPMVRYPSVLRSGGPRHGPAIQFQIYVTVCNDQAFENDFFGYLESIGQTGPMTPLSG